MCSSPTSAAAAAAAVPFRTAAMDTPAVIQSMIHLFRLLQSSDSRSQAVDALAQDLSPYEWRHLQSVANSKSFQYDVVGRLPLEIVALIFSYLDPSVPFRLQRVSRRWNTLLHSLDVLKPALRAWCDDSARLEGADYQLCAQTAQDIHRFRTGTMADVVTKKGDGKLHVPHCTVLVEDVLVSVCNVFQRELFVDNLTTRTSIQLHGDARERIHRVAASDQLIAFATTRAQCYVSDLHGENKSSFRLAMDMFRVLVCRGRVVVCAGLQKDAFEIYIWHFDSQKGTSFRIPLNDPPFRFRRRDCPNVDIAILPNPYSQTLTVLSSNKCAMLRCLCHDDESHKPGKIHYALFSFDGKSISQGEFHDALFLGAFIRTVRPVDRRGGFCVEAEVLSSAGLRNASLQFDEVLQTFTRLGHPVQNSWFAHASTVWWRDSYYQVLPHDHRPFENNSRLPFEEQHGDTRHVLLAHLGTNDHTKFKPVLLDTETASDARGIYIGGGNTYLLLNDKFAVIMDDAQQGSLHLVSFQSRRT